MRLHLKYEDIDLLLTPLFKNEAGKHTVTFTTLDEKKNKVLETFLLDFKEIGPFLSEFFYRAHGVIEEDLSQFQTLMSKKAPKALNILLPF